LNSALTAPDEVLAGVARLTVLTERKLALSVPEAAVVTGRSVATIYRAVRSGRLPTVGRGRLLLEDLTQYLRCERDARVRVTDE